jgi:hypothetical protein
MSAATPANVFLATVHEKFAGALGDANPGGRGFTTAGREEDVGGSGSAHMLAVRSNGDFLGIRGFVRVIRTAKHTELRQHLRSNAIFGQHAFDGTLDDEFRIAFTHH